MRRQTHQDDQSKEEIEGKRTERERTTKTASVYFFTCLPRKMRGKQGRPQKA